MPPAQLTQSGLGANSQAATSSSRDRRPRVGKRQTKPTTQRDVTGMLSTWFQRRKFAIEAADGRVLFIVGWMRVIRLGALPLAFPIIQAPPPALMPRQRR